MGSLPKLLRQIYFPGSFSQILKILNQITIPKLDNEIILLLRNVIMTNNKDIQQFDGLVLAVKIIKQSLNYDYMPEEWLKTGENFSCLIVAIFDSILLYQNTSYIKNATFCNLILETGKSLLPIVDSIDCLRMSINNSGLGSILQLICLDNLDFLVRKEIFILLKPIIVKSDTRQRKNIMNSNESFLSKMASFILECGDYETQEGIVEILMRFSYTSKQKLNKLLFWFRSYPSVLIATKLLDYKNFDISCRKFLNSVNATINTADKVLTLPCYEAYANDIKLQKPSSEQYEELWVDFSLKTGIIHIVCDSGANAWLRLFIESKNVRKSFFSSRLLQNNETAMKGKQILLELISPLEIELHLKESLIVTVTLTFVESSKLDYLQTNFFDKWYNHLNKAEKNCQFEALSKAFKKSVHQRCKHQDRFFSGASVSSMSTIRSCSTCSFKEGCCKKGNNRFRLSKCKNLSFSTSTPKEKLKCPQETPSSSYNFMKTITAGPENVRPSPGKFVSLQSTPSISGGIFNQSSFHDYQKPETKSTIVKGIFISDDKEEDGLFKKMIEESLKKEKDKQFSANCQNEPSKKDLNDDKINSSIEIQAKHTASLASSSLNNLPLKIRTAKHGMLNSNIANIKVEKNGISEKSCVNSANICHEKNSSEESAFVLTTYGNKHNILKTENEGLLEVPNSSSSQIVTSDEAPTKSAHIDLLNSKRKVLGGITKLKTQNISEKPQTLDNNNKSTDSGIQETTPNKNPSLTIAKKQILHSPYLKLFNLNSNTSSVHGEKVTPSDVTDKQSEKNLTTKRTENFNPTFKLKPSILNINNAINSTSNSFSFLSFQKINTASNTNQESTILHKSKTNIFENIEFIKEPDEENAIKTSNEVDSSKNKNLKNLRMLTNNGKRKCVNDLKKLGNISETAEINIDPTDEIDLVDDNNNEDEVKSTDTKEKKITKQKDNQILNNSCLNINDKQTNKDFTMFLCSNNQNHSPVKANNQKNKCNVDVDIENNGDIFSQHLLRTLPSTSSDSVKNSNNSAKDKVRNKSKRKFAMKKKHGKVSTDTKENSSLGPNTTNSTLNSYHCIAIPKKTYSTRPINAKAQLTPDKVFDSLTRQTVKNYFEHKKPLKIVQSTSRKRKLYTPNSSLEETNPYKPTENSVHTTEMLFQDNTSHNANKRKFHQNLNTAVKLSRNEKIFKSPNQSADVYNFSDSNHSVNDKKENKGMTKTRRSLRSRTVKQYKELSSDEFESEIEPTTRKKIKSKNQKKVPVTQHLTLPSEKLSVTEKVSKFVQSINENRAIVDMIRDEDLESEMKLNEAPVEENKSDVSQLEAVEPPVWLSAGGIEVPSPLHSIEYDSDISLTAPTLLYSKDNSKEKRDEIEFLESVITNIECLTLSVKRKPQKINSEEKFVKTVQSFTSSNLEEMKKQWEETRNSLKLMMSNLDNMSESCTTFMLSFEKRMKDMIESSVSEFNKERSNHNNISENLCKKLKQICHERHKLLKDQ